MLFLSQGGGIVDSDQLDDLTPRQLQTLRRETKQRKAARQLATVFLDSEGPFSSEFLQSVLQQLEQHELCQVRGIAMDNKRHVKATTERLALELGMENSNSNKPVFVVDIQGHAAILYSPNGTIPLRTTLKGNQWEKRTRKPRDSAGQIIR